MPIRKWLGDLIPDGRMFESSPGITRPGRII